MNKEGSCVNPHVGTAMRGLLLLFCVLVAALAAPAPRRSILGRLGAATVGIGIGSSATNLATGIASQSLGLAGQALGQIPILGPIAQFGASIGQSGIEVGNSFAQMGLGIGQAAVNSHAVGAAPIKAGVAQNIIQGLAESTRATAVGQGGGGSTPTNQPTPASQQTPANQPTPANQQTPANQRTPTNQPANQPAHGASALNDIFGPEDDDDDYDYYGDNYDNNQAEWNSAEESEVQQDSNSRPPPPQPTYVGAK